MCKQLKLRLNCVMEPRKTIPSLWTFHRYVTFFVLVFTGANRKAWFRSIFSHALLVCLL